MFISWRGSYVVRIFFIHSTNNVYATSVPKTFIRILTGDYMHRIGHHMTWFKFQIMNFKNFQKYIHNGSWIVHKNIKSSMVKTVFESDASLSNYREKTDEIRVDACMSARVSMCQLASARVRWNSQLAERFICGNELVLIHSTIGLYASSRQNVLYVVWPGNLCIRSAVSGGFCAHQHLEITHLDLWFCAFNRPTCDMIQITNLETTTLSPYFYVSNHYFCMYLD
jgi:hypothetical protein